MGALHTFNPRQGQVVLSEFQGLLGEPEASRGRGVMY